MSASLSFRIFLASPGDARPERTAVRGLIEAFNVEYSETLKATYDVVGYESVRGTARRPQEAINELIHECHFLVVILKGEWGSEPGSPWGYASGTEEELFTALMDLSRDSLPMRDVWIAFMDCDNPDSRITALKRQMIDRHIIYFEECSDTPDLERKLLARLQAWVRHDEKVSRQIGLLPTSGIDVLGADKLRFDGETLIGLGYPEIGLAKLCEAAETGGPDEKLTYARYLGRVGKFPEAHAAVADAIQLYIDGGEIRSPAAAEAYAADAALLRRQKRDVEAITKLRHALELLSHDQPEWYGVKSRVYDDLGLALQAQGDLGAARASFQSALDIRTIEGDPALLAQSEINLARIERAENRTSANAMALARAAVERLHDIPPTAIHANAQVLLAQQCLYVGQLDDAERAARTAVTLNAQFGNQRGSAISQYVLARALSAKGDYEGSIKAAEECARLNRAMGDEEAAQRAERLAKASGDARGISGVN